MTNEKPTPGKPAPASLLADLPKLVTAYYTGIPDPAVPTQRVAFGTSGHRGSSLELGFNEAHVLAMTQAICSYRKQEQIGGPVFLGFDTHALSAPAFASSRGWSGGRKSPTARSTRSPGSTRRSAAGPTSTSPRPRSPAGASATTG